MQLNLRILWEHLAPHYTVGTAPEGAEPIEGVRLFGGAPADHVGCACLQQADGSTLCAGKTESFLIESEDITGIFNRLLGIFEQYNDWERAILTALSTHTSLQVLLDAACTVFQNPAVITDASHDALALRFPRNYGNSAYDDTGILHTRLPVEMLAAINRSLGEKIHIEPAYVDRCTVFPHPAIVKNLFQDRVLIGWFVILEAQEEDLDRLMWIADRLGGYIERWLALDGERPALVTQAALFLDILSGRQTDDERLSMRLTGIGWKPEDAKLVFCIGERTGMELIYPVLQRLLPQTFSGCYAAVYEGALLLFANLRIYERETLFQTLSGVFSTCGVSCGVSYPFTDIMKLKSSLRQAEIAARYGDKTPGAVNVCGDYALVYLRDILREHLGADVRHPALRRLKDYDAANQSEYYWTLLVYLLNERELTATAKALCIHRNTVVYRIGRLHELTGLDLGDQRTRLHLMASFFIEAEFELPQAIK